MLERCTDRESWAYSSAFYSSAADVACPEPSRRVFLVLGAMTSLDLRSDEAQAPFRPIREMGGHRSAAIDDFTAEQLAALSSAIDRIEDAELRARIGDVLWLRNRDHKGARVAVAAYLETAERMEDPDNWSPCFERIERAVRLSASLGRQNPAHHDALRHVQSMITKYNGEDPLFLSARLMALLLDHGAGDTEMNAWLAVKLALRAEERVAWYVAREYWRLGEKWLARLGSSAQAQFAARRSCETYVAEADQAIGKGDQGSLLASMHLESAIAALRKIGGQQDRVNDLHRRMLDHQTQAAKLMKMQSFESDVTDLTRRAVAVVEGKPLRDALVALALITSSPSRDALRTATIESLRQFPLKGLATSHLQTERGKTIARIPALNPVLSNSGYDEDAVQLQMFRDAALRHSIDAQAIIEPCRERIWSEHNVRRADFESLAAASAFVPPGREPLFALGLHAGITGDYLVAAHLLVPQVEHAIRCILESRGVVVSGLNDAGIQAEFGLNRLLQHDKEYAEVERALGRDRAFDLRGLLVEKTGSNLRNLVAHGLLVPQQFYSPVVSYFWWLVLHLCVCGALRPATAATETAPTT